MAATSHLEFYTQGAFAPYVVDRKLIASAPAAMLEIAQPAGDFPDPPLPELIVIQDKGAMRATCDFGAGRFQFAPGCITLVPTQSATKITVEMPHRFRTLAICATRLDKWFEDAVGANRPPDLGRLHASGFRSVLIDQLMDRLWIDAGADGLGTSLLVDAALLTLWSELLRQAQATVVCPRGGLAPWQVRRSTEYLNANAAKSISLEQLASQVSLSPFHFARAFKQTIGVPPHNYQLSLRIARAKALLETSDASVTEIAFDVGYASSQALARLFHSHVGVSPSDYRRKHRQ